MKTAVIHRADLKTRPDIPYPNAATRKEMFDKLMDLILVAAIGAGLAASLLFLLVLL